jgi:hypothetical protein
MLARMMSNKTKNSLNSTACFLYGIREAWSTIKSRQLWDFVFAIHLQLSMDDCNTFQGCMPLYSLMHLVS